MTIAVLGLGAMGSRMALRLTGAGHSVTVWNRDSAKAAGLEAAGARVAATPRAAAAGSDIVLAMVSDDAASRSVWLAPDTGALQGLRAGALAIECSTLSLAWTRELNSVVTAAGADFIDAPVAGSRPQAEAGQLVVMAGGRAAALEKARPALAAIAGKILHVGASGQGTLMKLAVNAFFAAQLASLAELTGLLRRGGLAAGHAADLLAEFPIVAAPIAGAAKAMAAGNMAPQFTIDLIEKDLGYALEAALLSGAELPGVEACRAAFRRAQQKNLGAANVTGIAAVYA